MVRLAAPFFHDFNLRPALANPGLIELQWTQKDSANCFSASQLSDSTLRFICLATALLQPCLPPVTLFDEPELGVHPRALTLLANLFQRAARKNFNQVIVSTQSAALLKEFAPEDVIVVDHYQGESTFRRLQAKELAKWLKEFICGELWQTDISSATPYQKGLPQPSHAGGNQHP
jgi:predicted ATPase